MKQFKKLCKCIKPLWKQAEKNRLNRSGRLRKKGAGRKYELDGIEEKVALILIYYRTYAIQDLLGYMFGIDQSNISRLIKKMEPLIEKAASPNLKGQLNKLKEEFASQKSANWIDFINIYPEAAGFITDATEVKCLRPKDKEKQKKYYSGKKKTHTIKTQITVSRKTELVLDVSNSYAGSVHDKKVFDTEKTIENIFEQTPHWMDLGYLGVQCDHPKHYNILPSKSPPKKELPESEKETNKVHSKIRIHVEHILSRIKKFKILAQTYRGRIEEFNQIFRNIAAIYNFKMQDSQVTC